MPPNAHVCAKKKKKEKRKKEITPTRLARCRRSRGRLSRTALAKLQRGGALRRGDCRSWPSFFLVWSETCAPLPFPHPNLSLYYYRLARGAQRGARWAARCHSKPCVCCLERCVLLGFFFDGLIVVRDRTAWRHGYRLPRQGRRMATRAEGFSTCVKVEARLGHKTAPLWVQS